MGGGGGSKRMGHTHEHPSTPPIPRHPHTREVQPCVVGREAILPHVVVQHPMAPPVQRVHPQIRNSAGLRRLDGDDLCNGTRDEHNRKGDGGRRMGLRTGLCETKRAGGTGPCAHGTAP